MDNKECVPIPTKEEISELVDAVDPNRRPTTPGLGLEAQRLVTRERAIAYESLRWRRRLYLDIFLLGGAIAGYLALGSIVFHRGWR